MLLTYYSVGLEPEEAYPNSAAIETFLRVEKNPVRIIN